MPGTMPLSVTARQIYKAIKSRSKSVYITKRWALVAFILRRLPKAFYIKWFWFAVHYIA